MILFLEDWKKYPNAIIHESTKNKSFIRLAALYKRMGVENHAFILALHNRDLEFIDPHSPDLTIEQMVMVGIECRDNPWYFLREVLRDPAVGNQDTGWFLANRSNIALWWLYFNHITTILIQLRQTGKSFSLNGLILYLLNIAALNNQISLLTKDDTLRTITMDKIRDLEEGIPSYLVQRLKNDVSNTSEMAVSKLNNKLYTVLSSPSEKSANKVGKGFTTPTVFIDEAVYIPNIEIASNSILPATGAARDIAKRIGAPYGIVYASTVGDTSDRDARYVYRLLTASFVMTEKLFDSINLEDLEFIIKKNNNGILRVNCTYNHRQLGYTDEWLMEKISTAAMNGESAEKDYYNKWVTGGARHPLSPELLDRIKASEQEPKYVEISKEGYLLNWYIEESEIFSRLCNYPSILGMDTSNANGNDDIAMHLIDPTDGSTIMAATVNETNLITFSSWLLSFLVKYNKVVIIIENRSTGPAVIDYLLKTLPAYDEDPYKRMFNRIVNDAAAFPDRFKSVINFKGRKDESMLIRDKKHFGFSTSGSGLTSRSQLYGGLSNLAIKIGNKIKNTKTISQIMNLVKKNDRIDHEDGEHDDTVVALLLAFWLATNGENLHIYGINSNMILSASYGNVNETKAQIYDNMKMREYKEKVEELLGNLNDATDPNMEYLYEQKIRYLSSMINEENHLDNAQSIDEMISRIKEKKKLNNIKKYDSNYNYRLDNIFSMDQPTQSNTNNQSPYRFSSYLLGDNDRY